MSFLLSQWGWQHCSWVFGVRLQLIAGGNLRHFALARPGDFLPHSDETFWEVCDDLARRRATTRIGDFKKLEQNMGVNCQVDALPFDRDLRGVYRPISCLYWDWLHIMVASGGVCQFLVNAVALDVEAAGIELALLDRLLGAYMADNKTRSQGFLAASRLRWSFRVRTAAWQA